MSITHEKLSIFLKGKTTDRREYLNKDYFISYDERDGVKYCFIYANLLPYVKYNFFENQGWIHDPIFDVSQSDIQMLNLTETDYDSGVVMYDNEVELNMAVVLFRHTQYKCIDGSRKRRAMNCY